MCLPRQRPSPGPLAGQQEWEGTAPSSPSLHPPISPISPQGPRSELCSFTLRRGPCHQILNFLQALHLLQGVASAIHRDGVVKPTFSLLSSLGSFSSCYTPSPGDPVAPPFGASTLQQGWSWSTEGQNENTEHLVIGLTSDSQGRLATRLRYGEVGFRRDPLGTRLAPETPTTSWSLRDVAPTPGLSGPVLSAVVCG